MAKKQFTSDYDAEFAEADELEDPELQEMGEESRGKNPDEIESDAEESGFKEGAPEAEEL